MFGKTKATLPIEKEHLELLKNAQKRIKQKKRLYIHFVIFLFGALFLIIANTVLGIGEGVTFFGTEWFVYAILIWFFLLLYHVFNVFVTQKFMGKAWEEKQLRILVAKQKEGIQGLHLKMNDEEGLKEPEKKKSELTLIVAAGSNHAIGKDNKLIWYLRDDLKRFKMLTNGHHIIMGRKTFESFPKPLKNRTHVVISRQENYQVPEGVLLVHSLEEALNASKNDSKPYVIGGGEIYRQAISMADKIEITRVHQSFDADTFFPEIDTNIWKEMANTFHKKDENNDYDFSFITYVRR